MSPHHATYRRLPYFDASSICTALPNGFSFCADNAGQLSADRHKKSPLAVPTSFDVATGNGQEALTLLLG